MVEMDIFRVQFEIDDLYPDDSDEKYQFCYLAKHLVSGTAQGGLNNKKLSAIKSSVFEKQHKDEVIPLMRMLLLKCDDVRSSDKLKPFDACSRPDRIMFTGKAVGEDKRMLYNMHCLFVYIATSLDEDEKSNLITIMREKVSSKSGKTAFQTILLLLEKANQKDLIQPRNLDHLKQWLESLNRPNLIRDVNQFNPREQFPGLSTPIPETGHTIYTPAVPERSITTTTEEASTTTPDHAVSVAGASTREQWSKQEQESGDSAIGDEVKDGNVTASLTADQDRDIQRRNNTSPTYSNEVI